MVKAIEVASGYIFSYKEAKDVNAYEVIGLIGMLVIAVSLLYFSWVAITRMPRESR